MRSEADDPESQCPVKVGMRFGKYQVTAWLGAGRGYFDFAARALAAEGFGAPVRLRLQSKSAGAWLFFHEASISKLLRHPGIARFHDSGCEGELCYLVTELVAGLPLAPLLAERGPLPWPAWLALAGGLLEPLAYAHEKTDERGAAMEFVHAQLGPESVFVMPRGAVKLDDFRCMCPGRVNGGDGALRCLAPEQARGLLPDARSDVFGAARVLYEASTGVFPFDWRFDLAGLRRFLDEPVTPPSTHVPGYPAALEELLLAAMERRPEQRLASARALWTLLRGVGRTLGLEPSTRALAQYAAPRITAPSA